MPTFLFVIYYILVAISSIASIYCAITVLVTNTVPLRYNHNWLLLIMRAAAVILSLILPGIIVDAFCLFMLLLDIITQKICTRHELPSFAIDVERLIISEARLTGMNTNEKSITNLREAWDLVLRTINYKLDASYLAAICFCLNCINMNKETDIEIPEPLERALKEIKDPIRLCTYLLKQPLFEQGAVTIALIVANKELIHTKRGILLIPEEKFPEFNRELDAYRKSNDDSQLYAFLSSCIEPFPETKAA